MTDLVAAIQAAYEKDMAQDRVARTASELPTSYESITDEWLTAVLCARHPGAQVLSHRLSETDNGSSNRRKIYLAYNAAGEAAGLPKAVFCKATHDLRNRIVLGVSGGSRCEEVFYNAIRPLLPIEAPVSHYAYLDPVTYNSMIIMDDISDTVTTFCDDKTDMPRARAESQMRLLGTLHGHGYGNPALQAPMQDLPTWKGFFDNTKAMGMKEGSNAGFLAGEAVIPARLFARYDEVWDKTTAAVDASHAKPHTLAHGDVHLKNWYVAGNGEMGLGDWQCLTRGHWARDVAYTVASALTIENRRAWERELLALYLDEMAAAGGPKIGFDEAFADYRRQLIPALTWWTVTLTPPADLPDMQPRDTTLNFIQRIATALDDHASLDIG